MGKKNLQRLVAILLLSVAVFTPLYAAEPVKSQDAYTFAIGPQQSVSELAKHWIPILQYLSEKTGYSLHFATARDIPTFQRKMMDGAFDFAFINPYHYLIFHEKAGYKAFAHERGGSLTGIIMVRKDGPIHSMHDLNNQTIAFPAPTAIAATMLPLAYFDEQNIHVIPKYVVSMDSVSLSVAKGFFPAGGGEIHIFKFLDPQTQDQLRILWTSETLPPFPFVVHPRVPNEVVARLQKAMQEMEKDTRGAELLKAIHFKGIVPANDSAYDSMHQLKLKVASPASKR